MKKKLNKLIKRYGIGALLILILISIFGAGYACGAMLHERLEWASAIILSRAPEKAVEIAELTARKTETEEEPVAPKTAYMGEFRVTAYCPCKQCSEQWGTQTSTGATATAGRTIAVDPSIIPYGTKVIINGNEYIAEDRGSAIKGNMIDIFFDSHAETQKFGVQYFEVYEVR